MVQKSLSISLCPFDIAGIPVRRMQSPRVRLVCTFPIYYRYRLPEYRPLYLLDNARLPLLLRIKVIIGIPYLKILIYKNNSYIKLILY